MVRKLKRIGPLQFGLVIGIVYGLFSLVMIPFFILFFLLSLLAPNHGGEVQLGLSLLGGIIFCIFMPILYAVLGFVFGALGALIYNLVAGWIGGIEFEVE